MNMGLVIEDAPSVGKIPASATSLVPWDVHNPHQQVSQVDAPAPGSPKTFPQRDDRQPPPLLDQPAIKMGAAQVTNAHSSSTRKVMKPMTTWFPASDASGKSAKSGQCARPKSGGAGQFNSHTDSQAQLSPPQIPRVAYLGAQSNHSRAQQQRSRFPLVGGLQSELDNDEAYMILEDTLRRTGRIDPAREHDVYRRQAAWRARVEAQADSMRREMDQEEISKCTFRPMSAKRSNSQPHAVCRSSCCRTLARTSAIYGRTQGHMQYESAGGFRYGNARAGWLWFAPVVGCKDEDRCKFGICACHTSTQRCLCSSGQHSLQWNARSHSKVMHGEAWSQIV